MSSSLYTGNLEILLRKVGPPGLKEVMRLIHDAGEREIPRVLNGSSSVATRPRRIRTL